MLVSLSIANSLTLPKHTTDSIMLTPDEISAIIDLIQFHDDWDEVSEQVGCDVEKLHDKLISMLSYATQG